MKVHRNQFHNGESGAGMPAAKGAAKYAKARRGGVRDAVLAKLPPMPRLSLHRFALTLVALLAANSAQAEEFCANRPGLATSPCTVKPGAIVAEAGVGDWTVDEAGGDRSQAFTFGELLLRTGLTDTLDIAVSWAGYSRLTDRIGPVTTRTKGGGDVSVALTKMLAEGAVSASIVPHISLPVGKGGIGDDSWSAGVILPVAFDLSDTVGLTLDPEFGLTGDSDSSGHHVALGSVAGLSFAIADTVSMGLEVAWSRDFDPAGSSSELLGGLSLAWGVAEDLQLDVGANIGLNDAASDRQIYLGIARQF